MDKFIEIFYGLLYNEDTATYYWHNSGEQCCLKFGFYTLCVCAVVFCLFYYFYWSNQKVSVRASFKSWFKVGLFGMLVTFVASELILGSRCGLEGFANYIGETGADILVFCIYNAIIGFAIFYLLFSTLLQRFSKNAKNIPWTFMYRK